MAWTDAARIRRFTALAMVVLGISTYFAQQLSSADPADAETAILVSKMIPKYHLNRQEINDDVSKTLIDRFIKDLDPLKLYFLESDIEHFQKHRTTLDDEIKAGNVEFAYEVFNTYKERLARQMEVANQWVEKEHDFSINEEIETDEDKLTWAKTTDELDDRWRRRVKYELLQFKLADEESKEDGDDEESETLDPKERLHKRYRNSLLATTQYDMVDQLERYLTALATVFDPHSSYMSPQSWEDFEIQMRLSLDGIGAALQADDGYTVVASIVPGGAASDDGRLKVKDKIIGVGQEEGEIVDIFEMKLSDVVRMIRGPRGTVVRLQVKSNDDGKIRIIELTRKKIELKESEVKGEIINTEDRLGRPGRVGVISIPSFYRDFAGASGGVANFKSASADVKRVLSVFAREQVDVVIIDLRNNGGGSLTEAIEISGHFIDRGPVVQVKEPSGYIRVLEDEDSGVSYAGPLVVMCNRLSASASEIFAGVIKDYHRGLIIGDTTTHGKGTVQNLMDVAPQRPFRLTRPDDRGKLKLTIQQFYRVKGDSTQNRGVRSDIVLPSLIDHWDLGEAFLDNALPFDKIRSANYVEERSVNPALISALAQNSQVRVKSDEDFQRVERSIARYIEKKNRTNLSLNEDKVREERAADRAASKADKEAEEEEEVEVDEDEKPIFPDNYYNNEALNIALDYVAALRGNLTVLN
ncbi:Tail-specific protease precursor [Thalassoglobus neptunius]|uniref:Tail-specific protease n=1 Tax=Thalassoglobus neptunius TaxID=1938619 RepID=A0A5C5X9F8_9PLAN|nr:carboxy terminal-processing peptidase [Thalassoglobus neptunius]TWT58502.1 Tail-specific protease precursor [Thalassoglobus neptunius]